jgi:hypothetical protein
MQVAGYQKAMATGDVKLSLSQICTRLPSVCDDFGRLLEGLQRVYTKSAILTAIHSKFDLGSKNELMVKEVA